jgi:hypothetical protein
MLHARLRLAFEKETKRLILDVCVLQLPEHGLAPDDEVEVSVDLVAPERPGRYVSHWRLVAPAGPKFGHRVWVLIQVLLKQIFATSLTFLALLLVFWFACEQK